MASPAAACDTALLLAVDVSGSIAMDEYYLQMDGLAEPVLDPAIINALVRGKDKLAMVQWSGDRFQPLPLPWTQCCPRVRRQSEHCGQACVGVRDRASIAPKAQGRAPGTAGKLAPHVLFLVGIVTAEPDITLRELSGALVETHGLRVDLSAIHRALDRAGLSYEKGLIA